MDIAKFSSEKLVAIVANLIEIMLKANNKIPNTQITCFYSRAVPNISILSYITRIHKFTPFSNEVLLSILVYFDRISKKDTLFTINSYNIHRLLIASIVVASKFTSDIYYANSRYAKVGGIPLQELNQLELKFLFLIDFELHITLKDLQDYANQLLNYAMTSIRDFDILAIHPQTNISNTVQAAPSSFPTSTACYSSSSFVSPSNTMKSKVLPLTPPYHHPPSSSIKSYKQKYHPYQTPNLHRKQVLGLVSPKV